MRHPTEREYHQAKAATLWPHRHHPIDRRGLRWHLVRLREIRDAFAITHSAGCEVEADGVTPSGSGWHAGSAGLTCDPLVVWCGEGRGSRRRRHGSVHPPCSAPLSGTLRDQS